MRKTAAKRDVADKVAKSFDWMLRPLVRLEKTPLERMVRAPAAFIARIKSDMERGFKERLDQVGHERLVVDFFGDWVTPEGIPAIVDEIRGRIASDREQIEQHPVGASLLRACDEAHAAVRNSPIALLTSPQDHEHRYELALDTMRIIHEAHGRRGEIGARLALRAAGTASERLYRPFVENVWRLARYRSGVAPSANVPDYGVLARQIPDDWRDNIVEPFAVKVRNADAHGQHRYLPDRRLLEFWDRDEVRVAVSARELLDLAVSLQEVSVLLQQRVLSFWVTKPFLDAGLFEIGLRMGPLLRAGKPDELSALNAEAESRAEAMIADIAACHARARQAEEQRENARKRAREPAPEREEA